MSHAAQFLAATPKFYTHTALISTDNEHIDRQQKHYATVDGDSDPVLPVSSLSAPTFRLLVLHVASHRRAYTHTRSTHMNAFTRKTHKGVHAHRVMVPRFIVI